MSEQHSQAVTTTATATVGEKWGDPISEERQAELQGYLDRWAAETDHGKRRGPFDGVKLTGADLFWQAVRENRGDASEAQGLHLEWANLQGAHLEEAALTYAHLEGADLREAHLENISLGRAQLKRAKLGEANLTSAFLIFADLGESDLISANLEEADLRSVNFEGAILSNANLHAADLRAASFDKASKVDWANFAGARLDRATFDNTNLSVVSWRSVRKVGDEILARQTKDAAGKRKNQDTHFDEFGAAVRANRRLAVALQSNGLNEDAARYNYRAQLCQRSVLFYERRYFAWLGSWFLAALAGYGYRPGRTILWYLAMVGGFALAFFLFGPSSAVHLTWNEALVVSLTAFHGRGFFATTFQPSDPLAALAAAEAVIGLLIEISFIATFTQRFFNSR